MAGTLAGLAGLAPACSTMVRKDNHTAALPNEQIITVGGRHEVRMLQLTDIHFFNGAVKTAKMEAKKRQRTIDDVRLLIDHTNPDFLMITGDLWHDNPFGRGEEFMQTSLEHVGSWGLPWAFTWGNHDQLTDYSNGHTALSSAKHCLYKGGASEGNYVLTLADHHGGRIAEIFCLNTNHRGMGEEQRAFVSKTAFDLDSQASTGAPPLRLAAFHIPLRQYQDVWDDGSARGIIGENVCFEQEDRSSLAVLKSAGVKAAFCGHDHVNDYSADADGVELIYGRATGYGGYGAETVPKGGKLHIITPETRAYRWESVLMDGKRWVPATDMRIDKREKK